MTLTRTARVSIGPFPSPVTPLAAARIHRFVGEAEVNGWIAVLGRTDEGIVISAVRVDPVRTIRQRARNPQRIAEDR